MFARQQCDESRITVESCRHCKEIARLSLRRADMARVQHIHRKNIAQDPHDIGSTRTYIVAFTALCRSIMVTKILQASHRHCKMPAPGWHYTRTTSPLHPQPCDACDFQKMFNSALDCLRSPQEQQLSQLAGPVELHDHRKKLRDNPPQRSCRSIVGHL